MASIARITKLLRMICANVKQSNVFLQISGLENFALNVSKPNRKEQFSLIILNEKTHEMKIINDAVFGWRFRQNLYSSSIYVILLLKTQTNAIFMRIYANSAPPAN